MSEYDRRRVQGLGFANTGKSPSLPPLSSGGSTMVGSTYTPPPPVTSRPPMISGRNRMPQGTGYDQGSPMDSDHGDINDMPMDSDNGYNAQEGAPGTPDYNDDQGRSDAKRELKKALAGADGDEATYAAVDSWRRKMQAMGYSADEIQQMEDEMGYGDSGLRGTQ